MSENQENEAVDLEIIEDEKKVDVSDVGDAGFGPSPTERKSETVLNSGNGW